MICRNCGKETPSGGGYCIHCGASLSDAEQYSDSNSTRGENDIGLLHREIQQLSHLITNINDRLSSIEREHGIIPVDFEAVESREMIEEEVHEVVVEEVKVPETIVEEEEKVKPVVETWTSPVEETIPVSPPPVKREPSEIQREWEQILGGNWLARIGVFTLIIGAAFFLKFAFDKNWLGPLGRVILGVVAGFVMLAGGHYWRKKYPSNIENLRDNMVNRIYFPQSR